MAPLTKDSPSGEYILGRNLNGRIRLNHQHFTNTRIFGYLLHPSVPCKGQNLQVADLGTGSGIWLFDVAPQFHASTQFHGLDISLGQVPPRGPWIPPNFHFSELDLTADVPAELRGKFDIINIRFLVLVLFESPADALRKAQQMLKPGGWLQWCESDLPVESASTLLHADAARDGSAMLAMNHRVRTARQGYFGGWVLALDKYFVDAGFEHVVRDEKKPQDYPLWLAFVNDTTTAAYGEYANHLPDGQDKQEMQRVYAQAADETWAGTYWSSIRVNVVGQKSP